jgi:hypothetical protein
LTPELREEKWERGDGKAKAFDGQAEKEQKNQKASLRAGA